MTSGGIGDVPRSVVRTIPIESGDNGRDLNLPSSIELLGLDASPIDGDGDAENATGCGTMRAKSDLRLTNPPTALVQKYPTPATASNPAIAGRLCAPPSTSPPSQSRVDCSPDQSSTTPFSSGARTVGSSTTALSAETSRRRVGAPFIAVPDTSI